MFKVGDRVRAAGNSEDAGYVTGLTGVVVVDHNTDGCNGGRLYGVEWAGFSGGHSCGGHAKNGGGWNLEEQDLVKSPTFKGNKHATAS